MYHRIFGVELSSNIDGDNFCKYKDYQDESVAAMKTSETNGPPLEIHGNTTSKLDKMRGCSQKGYPKIPKQKNTNTS